MLDLDKMELVTVLDALICWRNVVEETFTPEYRLIETDRIRQIKDKINRELLNVR